MPFGELLEQHRVAITPLAIHRERLPGGPVLGVVRGFSKRLVLIEAFGEVGRLAGFTLIRRADITRIDRATAALRRCLRDGGPVARSHPIAREVDLLDWRTALASAQRIASVLHLCREGVDEAIPLAAGSLQVTKHLVLGERPDPVPADEGEVALDLDHLTRLDFA